MHYDILGREGADKLLHNIVTKANAEIYKMPTAQIYPLAISRILVTELINYFIDSDY